MNFASWSFSITSFLLLVLASIYPLIKISLYFLAAEVISYDLFIINV